MIFYSNQSHLSRLERVYSIGLFQQTLMKLLIVVSWCLVYGQFTNSERCGNSNRGLMCNPNGIHGSCCSSYGYCGITVEHCSVDRGCQSGCKRQPTPTSPAPGVTNSERCGSFNRGLMCNPNGIHGSCCSRYGYCGITVEHCSVNRGCQSGCKDQPSAKPAPVGCKGECDDNISGCECTVKYLDKCKTPGHVALTFDDGPGEFSENLISIADQLNVKLTLFVIGNKLSNPQYREAIKSYHRAGHTIASHTFSHPYITKLTEVELRDELKKTDDAIFEIINMRPIFMRNPYSDSNQQTMSLIHFMGYKSIFTSLDTEDTVHALTNPGKILSNVNQALQADPKTNSFVITQHETYNVSVNYLPSIVDAVRKRNYKIVDIATCFGAPTAYR